MALNYWGSREEQLVLDYIQAEHNSKAQWKAHWELEGKVKHMGRQILYRYHNRYDEYIVQEAVDEVFLKLLTHFHSNKCIKAYSYCQTVIRNHFLDTLVRPNKYEEQSLQEYPSLADEIQFIHDQTMEECQTIEQRIIRRFTELYRRDEARLQSATKTGSTTTINDVRKYLPFIKYCIEYIERFGAQGSLRSICEYCSSNLKMTDVQWKKCSIHVFEYDYQPHKFIATDRYKEKNGKFKKDVESVMLAFINDDIAIGEYKLKAGRKTTMKKRSIYHDDNNN